jgi:hypothetical protein
MYILAGFCVYIALFEKERDRDEWSGDWASSNTGPEDFYRRLFIVDYDKIWSFYFNFVTNRPCCSISI